MEEKQTPSRKELAHAIRVLSMDAVEKAKSGHPGAPMGMADMAEALWNGFLKHNPANPAWPDRDRVVLSNGHASMLLYAALHLSGYDLSLDDLKNFRQLHSKTPGHPEYGYTPGVETTTGPLGQGLGMAVGLALAERMLAVRFNRDGFPLVDHFTYVFLGDGCLMEGISQEAASLAGTLGLGKLIALYDDNNISIDGQVAGWFADDTPARFKACGWQVIGPVDGQDSAAVRRAIAKARKNLAQPSLICCKTTIGYGAPKKAGTASCHGSPLGAEEIAGARAAYGWTHGPFEIPENIRKAWNARAKGKRAEKKWQDMFAVYSTIYPDLAREFSRRTAGDLPANWGGKVKALMDKVLEQAARGAAEASRISSREALSDLTEGLPELCGGCADLSGSVGTRAKSAKDILPGAFEGNYIYYGVREFGMGAVMNGLALHGGFIPCGGTFLVFSDYARNSIRLAALMKRRVIWLLSHDSIGVGEDGPTHQPVEHVPSLRLIPGLKVWRPGDAVETAAAWITAVGERSAPSALILSRQNLPALPHQQGAEANALCLISRGAYVLKDCAGTPEVILMGTGSETHLALEAGEILAREGRRVRVVSMPCAEVFAAQNADYQESVLPAAVRARVAVEAAHVDWWRKYVGLDGRIIGMSTFGESAPGNTLFDYFKITVDAVVDAARDVLK